MSTLMKKPLIEEICEGLDAGTIETVRGYLDESFGYEPSTISPAAGGEGAKKATVDGKTGVLITYATEEGARIAFASYEGIGLDKVRIYRANADKAALTDEFECYDAQDFRDALEEAREERGGTECILSKSYQEGLTEHIGFDNGATQIGGPIEIDGNVVYLDGKNWRIYAQGNAFKIEELKTVGGKQGWHDILGEFQRKLSRHVLLLTTANGTYYKEYLTDSNLPVDSLTDLTTITHAKEGTRLVLDSTTSAIYGSGVWKIGDAVVTKVTDTVENS